jgi:hypothetical protein
MTAKVDSKKRVTLKEARPGDVFDVEYLGAGYFKLTRLVKEGSGPATKTPGHQPEHPNPDSGR